jgi:hypothetical protein
VPGRGVDLGGGLAGRQKTPPNPASG